MYILHFQARTSALKDGRLNERSNYEQEDNGFVSGCSEQNGSNDSPVQTESSADSVDSVSKAETSDKPDNKTIIDSLNNGIIIDEVSGNVYKNERNANPISPSIFCADPTAVEYDGRLYVYGTNKERLRPYQIACGIFHR